MSEGEQLLNLSRPYGRVLTRRAECGVRVSEIGNRACPKLNCESFSLLFALNTRTRPR